MHIDTAVAPSMDAIVAGIGGYAELARRTGKTRNAVYNWTVNGGVPKHMAEAVAKATGLPVEAVPVKAERRYSRTGSPVSPIIEAAGGPATAAASCGVSRVTIYSCLRRGVVTRRLVGKLSLITGIPEADIPVAPERKAKASRPLDREVRAAGGVQKYAEKIGVPVHRVWNWRYSGPAKTSAEPPENALELAVQICGTAHALAGQLGISDSALSVCRNRGSISKGHVDKLVEITGLPLDQIPVYSADAKHEPDTLEWHVQDAGGAAAFAKLIGVHVETLREWLRDGLNSKARTRLADAGIYVGRKSEPRERLCLTCRVNRFVTTDPTREFVCGGCRATPEWRAGTGTDCRVVGRSFNSPF